MTFGNGDFTWVLKLKQGHKDEKLWRETSGKKSMAWKANVRNDNRGVATKCNLSAVPEGYSLHICIYAKPILFCCLNLSSFLSPAMEFSTDDAASFAKT